MKVRMNGLISDAVRRRGVALRLSCVGPFIVHKEPADGSRSSIEVLVGAPDREVDIPVMQGKRDVSYCMREVPTANAALTHAPISIKPSQSPH